MGNWGDWNKGPLQKKGWCCHYRVGEAPQCRIRIYHEQKEKAVGELKRRLGSSAHGLPIYEILRVHEPGKTPGGMYVPAGIDACEI